MRHVVRPCPQTFAVLGPAGLRLSARRQHMTQAFSRILGSGFVVGERTVTNELFAKVCETSDEWIRERSGIQQRYFVREGTSTSDLGAEAAKKALADARL